MYNRCFYINRNEADVQVESIYVCNALSAINLKGVVEEMRKDLRQKRNM